MKKITSFLFTLVCIFLLSSAKGQSWDQGGNTSVLSTELGTNDLVNLNIVTNAQTRILVGSTHGNVGIGTDKINGFKLSVEGKIRTREVFVNLDSWADYVFEPNYKRMSLSELESYITKNKHLPGVEPTEKIISKPQSLGDNQVLLMEKIEELTLYIIELNNRIEELEATK